MENKTEHEMESFGSFPCLVHGHDVAQQANGCASHQPTKEESLSKRVLCVILFALERCLHIARPVADMSSKCLHLYLWQLGLQI